MSRTGNGTPWKSVAVGKSRQAEREGNPIGSVVVCRVSVAERHPSGYAKMASVGDESRSQQRPGVAIEIWESSEYEPLNSLRGFSTELRPHGRVLVGKGDQKGGQGGDGSARGQEQSQR